MKDAVIFHNKLAPGWDDRYARRSFQRRDQVAAKLLAGTNLAEFDRFAAPRRPLLVSIPNLHRRCGAPS
jgi:hypothetical protein